MSQIFEGLDPWSFIAPVHHPKKEEILTSLKKKRLIVMSGPTAVGKTKLALYIAEMLGGEIVSADSMQIYRGMDIGTAKPTLEERKEIPHHLIDIREVSESFSVVDFYEEAIRACKDILQREKVPIVVGGTGFYLHAFLYGPPRGPASIPEVRKHLQHLMETLGCEALYERLQMLDPEYAKTITEHDQHKIIRALEIITISKEPVSSFSFRNKKPENAFDCRCWFLCMPREKIYRKVEERAEAMVHMGFLDEVRALQKKGLEQNSSAVRSIGYRQALDFLKSPQMEEDFQLFLENFKKASRHYVKRQFTWFKKEPLFRWIDLDEGVDRVCEFILQDYEQGR